MQPNSTTPINIPTTALASSPTVAASDTNTQIAGATSSSGSAGQTYKSMSALKRAVGPKVYNQLMQGIASTICSDMQTQSDQLVQTIKDGENTDS